MAKNDIVVAGEKAMVCLYGGASDEGLNTLRYRRFCEKVANSTSYVPQGGAHVKSKVCLALLFAMNVMALAALTHNAQISLTIWMTIVNGSARCIKHFRSSLKRTYVVKCCYLVVI